MKKEYTPFGKYFSSLMKKRKQTITEAAKLFNVSIAYISAVEHGNREIPYEWINKIINIYSLNKEEIKDLKDSYYNTPAIIKISTEDIEKVMINFANNVCNNLDQKENFIKNVKRMLLDLRK